MREKDEGLLAALLRQPAERVAISFEGRQISFGEWRDSARGYATALARLGIPPGARVAVLAENRPEILFAVAGHLMARVIHVPINSRYRAAEITHILSDSGASAVLVDSAHEPLLDETESGRALPRIRLDGTGSRELFAPTPKPPATPKDLDAEATAVIIYTSGTTGKSKGVELSSAAIVEGIGALTRLWRWTERDKLVLALPLFHVHGLCIGVHGSLLHGNEIELLPRFDAGAVIGAFESGASVFMGVPTMYTLLLERLEAEPALGATLRPARLFTSGSAALPADDFARFEALTGHRILERYGMTETLLTLSNPYEGERRPGSVGRPVPSCETRVVAEDGQTSPPGEPGELWVRWSGLMSRYWNDPAATRRASTDGWFRTGDVVTCSEDGYYRIVGRKSVDIIKSGGFKISAREIEEVLARHPTVVECAVVGLPDPKWGQRIAVAVVTRSSDPPDQQLRALALHASLHLADFKRPRALMIFDRLPRNALGKLQKHLIVQRARRSGVDADA